MNLTELRLTGPQLTPYLDLLGQLRIDIFAEWPYLYQGDLDYERSYLQTYLKSKNSFIYLIFDEKKLIGATTAIALKDEVEEVQLPFLQKNINLDQIVYFGESLLRPEYRGLGIGKKFMQERILFAQNLANIKQVAFCSVLRATDDQRRPANYRPLDSFWTSTGFAPAPNLLATMSWKDIGESQATKKQLQFWLKNII